MTCLFCIVIHLHLHYFTLHCFALSFTRATVDTTPSNCVPIVPCHCDVRLAKPFAPRHLVVDTSPIGVMEDVSSHLKQLMPSNMAVSFQEVHLVVPPTPTMNLLIRDLAS